MYLHRSTYIYVFFKLTMQTPMQGEEEKAEAAILAAFVHWPCATARALGCNDDGGCFAMNWVNFGLGVFA